MSSAILWILLPGLLGTGLLFYPRGDRFPLISAAIGSILLTWIAWQLPIDVVLTVGPFSLEIAPSLSFFGRSLTLTDLHRPLLTLIYAFQTLWILGTVVARPSRLFIPISLICISLFVAAISVDPFLYAAIFIALAMLVIVPLLAPPGQAAGPGIIRFLIFQIFAVPFILFTGWILTGVEANPGNLDLILRSGLLLLLGFTFLLALFPFHSWIPMLSRESHPYAVGFLLFFLPTIATVFALGFFDRYAWLRDSDFIYDIFILIGSLGILLSGLWALVEHHLGRLLGFVAMMGIGFSLVGIGLAGAEGVQLFFALLLPQGFALWVMSVCLGALWRKDSALDISSLADYFKTSPLTLSGLILATLSVAGLPLLASFPPRMALFAQLGSAAAWAAIVSLLGCLALASAGARLLLAALPLRDKKQSTWVEEVEPVVSVKGSELSDPYIWVFLSISTLGLLGFGLFSRLLLAGVPDLASMFTQLFP
jgi:NADH-quinone oxidoreductase subunit N